MTTTACPSHDSAAARAIGEFCTTGYTPPTPAVREGFRAEPVWQQLASTGTALWLDTGDLDAAAELWTREFVALTTNNTLLNKEVQKGIYDELVPRAAKVIRDAVPSISDALLVQEIAFVLNAVHGLKLVSKFDADVSVELHTNLADDADASYAYGKRFAAINPDRFIVKVPLTPAGLFAARRLGADGIRVNFTLGFSARENHLIAAVAQPTWCNVFMGRCNALVSDAGIGDGKNVGEKATLASQRMLREGGFATKQIGASMRNGQQAIDLMGLDVYTMPTSVAADYLATKPTDVRDRTGDDPAVTLADGRSPEGECIDVLWALADDWRAAISALGTEDVDAMDGETLRTFLADHGQGDLFPAFSDDDRAKMYRCGTRGRRGSRRVARAGTAC